MSLLKALQLQIQPYYLKVTAPFSNHEDCCTCIAWRWSIVGASIGCTCMPKAFICTSGFYPPFCILGIPFCISFNVFKCRAPAPQCIASVNCWQSLQRFGVTHGYTLAWQYSTRVTDSHSSFATCGWQILFTPLESLASDPFTPFLYHFLQDRRNMAVFILLMTKSNQETSNGLSHNQRVLLLLKGQFHPTSDCSLSLG